MEQQSCSSIADALGRGDYPGAEVLARRLIAEIPSDLAPRHLLGLALAHQSRFDEAIAVLNDALAIASSPDVLGLLAQIHGRLHSYAQSEAALERLAEEFPRETSISQFQQLAKLKNALGKREEARAVLGRAKELHPKDVALMVNYADMFGRDWERSCAELEACLPAVRDEPHKTSFLLKAVTMHRGELIRANLGVIGGYGMSWQETYVWPDAEGVQRLRQALLVEASAPSVRGSAYLDLASVAISAGNWRGAEQLLALVRNNMSGTYADCLIFDAAFHAALARRTDDEIFAGFAPVQHLRQPAFQTGETIFIGADPNYFNRFTLPFLASLDNASIAADIQIHLLDGSSDDWSAAAQALDRFSVLRVGLSAEASRAAVPSQEHARLYYHAVRFMRLYQELSRGNRPLWVLDADVNFVRDPRPVLARIAGFDLALRTNPYCFEPTLKIMGGCVGFAPTSRGLEYARRVAAYIAHFKAKGSWRWGVDQLALFAVYAQMNEAQEAPRTLFLGPDAVCGLENTNGVFQFPAGIRKYLQTAAAAPKVNAE